MKTAQAAQLAFTLLVFPRCTCIFSQLHFWENVRSKIKKVIIPLRLMWEKELLLWVGIKKKGHKEVKVTPYVFQCKTVNNKDTTRVSGTCTRKLKIKEIEKKER